MSMWLCIILVQWAVRPWQELSWADYINKVCRYLQFEKIVGSRNFITVLNLSNRAWNTSYFNNERVIKKTAPKNLCRMIKNNILASQQYTHVATQEVASHKT